METVIITRHVLENPGQARRWTYKYVVEGEPMLYLYGPGLRSLRQMLRERRPGANVVETWKTK